MILWEKQSANNEKVESKPLFTAIEKEGKENVYLIVIKKKTKNTLIFGIKVLHTPFFYYRDELQLWLNWI